MSKNFELLRQAGWKQDFFDGAETVDTAPPRETGTPATPHTPRRYRAAGVSSKGNQISSLVQRVFLDARNPNIRSVVFSGVTPRAGCTWACAQAARTLASRVNGTVCVVDAHFAAPSVHGQFGVDNLVGLSDAIAQDKSASTLARQIESSNLHVLSAGGECGRAQSAGARIAQSLRELRREFDFVLIDVPPLVNGALVASIGRGGDGAILVVDSTGMALESLVKAKERLKRARVPLFGVVINSRRASSHSIFGQFFK